MVRSRLLDCFFVFGVAFSVTWGSLLAYGQGEGKTGCCSNNFSMCSGCVTNGETFEGQKIYAQIGTNQIQICFPYTVGPNGCTLDRR